MGAFAAQSACWASSEARIINNSGITGRICLMAIRAKAVAAGFRRPILRIRYYRSRGRIDAHLQ